MGRVKLQIKKLETSSSRQITYSKRRSGIVKKTSELSILCDIDILLLMFSPTGRLTLCLGERCTIEEVIARFIQLTPQERSKRKLECLEALKKTFMKLDHEVNIEDFIGSSTQTIEELSNQSRQLQACLAEIHKRLSYWIEPEKMNNIDEISAMEEALKQSIHRIQAHKESFGKQIMPLDFSGQFQNGMHLPLGIGFEQQPYLSSWLHNHDFQHIPSPEDQRLVLAQTDLEDPGSASFSNYLGYLGTTRQRPQNFLDDSSGNPCLTLQLAGQYPYRSYGHNLPNETRFKAEMGMGLQGPDIGYQVNGVDPTRPGYDTNPQNWASTSGHDTVPLIEEKSYPQQTM